MSHPDRDLNRLFHDMANQSAAPEAAVDQSLRRQRAIAGMRALHRRVAEEQGRKRQRRPYWTLGIIAAAVALCGSALAGAAGFWHLAATRHALQPSPASNPPDDRTPQAKPAAEAARAAAPTEPAPVAAPASAGVGQAKSTANPPRKTQTTDLERVNRLFAEAKRARRERRDADALALVQQLLAEQPGSVLAHEAAVERFRALARLGRTAEAQRFANGYLAHYPNGFAADEARRVASGETP